MGRGPGATDSKRKDDLSFVDRFFYNDIATIGAEYEKDFSCSYSYLHETVQDIADADSIEASQRLQLYPF